MSMRDYVAWHDGYDDPDSGLPWRLQNVRGYLDAELDRRAGRLQILSLCAGDGRDILGVLESRPSDAGRAAVTLVELEPALAAVARGHAARIAGAHVDVRVADAGDTAHYSDAVPADVLLLVGIFGNISDADIAAIVDALPQLCAPDALVIWSRGLVTHRDNDGIRARLAEVGCDELDYAQSPFAQGRTAVGAVRFTGTPRPLAPGLRLFTFVR